MERLAAQYNVKIVWSQKYHCELNPIKGFWCYSKEFVRKNNNQDFNILNDLIRKSIQEYKEKKINIKLWNRFWSSIEMYDTGSTYEEVLQSLFGAKSSANIKSHKKNKDFNNLIE